MIVGGAAWLPRAGKAGEVRTEGRRGPNKWKSRISGKKSRISGERYVSVRLEK
jgi:hypothetical protein